MRIAYLSTEFPPRIYGGLGVYVDFISKELVALNQDISVYVPGDPNLPTRELVDGRDVFRDFPIPMKDGLEPFFLHRLWDGDLVLIFCSTF
jgi:glycogen(starch) synthase